MNIQNLDVMNMNLCILYMYILMYMHLWYLIVIHV